MSSPGDKPRILVTGGAGYIGSHTIVELVNSGFPVVIVDSLINSSEESVRRVRKLVKHPDWIDFVKVIGALSTLQSIDSSRIVYLFSVTCGFDAGDMLANAGVESSPRYPCCA